MRARTGTLDPRAGAEPMMSPNLVVICISVALGLAALAFLASWGGALKASDPVWLGAWAVGCVFLAISTLVMFMVGSGSPPADSLFKRIAGAYVVFTTMSALVFPVVIGAVALGVGFLLKIGSRIFL